MPILHNLPLQPNIVLGKADHQKLIVLAMAGLGHSAEAADDLLYELERASVLADAALPDDIIAMGSRVRYRAADGTTHEVTLVYPADADIAVGKVSVLTPVGTALIGLRAGQSISWRTRDGRIQHLTVLGVTHNA